MHLLKAVVCLLLPLLATAAKKPSTDRFERFNTRAQSSAPIKLDDATYSALTATPRDYSVVVLLTALDNRFGCVLCREFQPEWELLAKSWTKGDKKSESRLVYGTLDFTDGKSTFQSVSCLVPEYCHRLIIRKSLGYRPHQYFCYSNQQLDHMQERTQDHNDMTLQAGE